MKRLLFFAMALIVASLAFGQKDTFYLHSKGGVVFQIAEDQLDSITISRATVGGGGDVSPVVLTRAAKEIYPTSAVVGATVTNPGIPAYTEMGVCYDTLTAPDLTKSAVSFAQPAGDTAEGMISGLIPGKTYYVRAYAINAVDTAYGQEISFTTLSSSKTSIFGIVTDLDNNPVANALVKVENSNVQEILTDSNGIYYFPEVDFTTKVSLTFRKRGYLEATRSNSLMDKEGIMIHAKMIPHNSKISKDTVIYSANALTLTFAENKAKVEIPADAYQDENNVAYTGHVVVTASYLDPTDSLFGELNPGGDMTAEDINGDFGYLFSMGIINVELTKPGGEKLQLKLGKKATLTAAIPNSLLTEADPTIPMWWYDNAKGLWIEDGFANKVGDEFVAEVSHFTPWNYDYICSMSVTVRGKITNQNNIPMRGVRVSVSGYLVYTNSNGEYICNINASRSCNSNSQTYIYVSHVPFTQCAVSGVSRVVSNGQTITQNFTIPGIQPTTIKGKVEDVQGNPVQGATIAVWPWGPSVLTDASGNYEINYSDCFSTSPKNVDLALSVNGVSTPWNSSYAAHKLVSITSSVDAIQDFIVPEICTMSGQITACGSPQNTAQIWITENNGGIPWAFGDYLGGTHTNSSNYSLQFMYYGSDVTVTTLAKHAGSGKELLLRETVSVAGCPSAVAHNIDLGCDITNDGSVDIPGCVNHNLDLGTVGFYTNGTWLVPAANGAPQTIWSDAVTTSNCSSKTTFASMADSSFITASDCRNNPGYPGDFFSGCAVMKYASVLCPYPWRVPTEQDFINLDKALGGTGMGRYGDATTVAKYLDPVVWKGSYSGMVDFDGAIARQNTDAYYWDGSQNYANGVCTNMHFNNSNSISFGVTSLGAFSLRCVKDF